MAIKIQVLAHLSPRIIKILSPTTSTTVQELTDAIKDWEDEPANLSYPILVKTSGKENLGGGLQVGITAELQNAQILFEQRTGSDSAGTATTADANGTILIDSAATFITDGIVPGDSVINTTDGSVATVLSVDLETQLTTFPLADGTDNDWDSADAYKIWNKIECEVSGGNLVAIDDLDAAMSPVSPSAFTFVKLVASSSATLLAGTAAPTASAVADAVWDELLTGSEHNVQNSAGKRLRNLSSQIVHTDTAQGPAVNGNQIELALAASSVDGAYDPTTIAIVDGTGAGQSRNILQYEGSTRIATVDRNWKVNPDATSEYVIYANAGREHVNEGLAQGGTSTTITLNTLASPIDDVYLYQTIFLRSGTGEDQVGIVTAYNGTTKVATIDGSWAVTPDTTTAYSMLPMHTNVHTEQFTAYAGEITIDTAAGTSGQAYPVGTSEMPVDNITDAKVLGASFGITAFRIVGTLVIGASDDISDLVFRGANPLIDTISLTSGCTTNRTTFTSIRLTGVVNGAVYVEKCGMTALTNIGSDTDPSLFNECIFLESTFSLRAGLSTPQNIQFVQCLTGVALTTGTILDFSGTTSAIAIRKHGGDLEIINHTGGQSTTIEIDQGGLTVAASCTSGTIIARGLTSLVDNSTGAMVVTNQTNAARIWDEASAGHVSAGSTGLQLKEARDKALLGWINTV